MPRRYDSFDDFQRDLDHDAFSEDIDAADYSVGALDEEDLDILGFQPSNSAQKRTESVKKAAPAAPKANPFAKPAPGKVSPSKKPAKKSK